MSDLQLWASNYDKNEHWPYMEREGRRYSCGDNYGDVECAFCDKMIAREGEEIAVGHACWNCGAAIAGFRHLRDEPLDAPP